MALLVMVVFDVSLARECGDRDDAVVSAPGFDAFLDRSSGDDQCGNRVGPDLSEHGVEQQPE
jgi:hypothetical protein